MKHLALAVGCAALAATAIGAGVRAQEPFPTRPIQVIVPATAGGPVDTGVRMIAPALEAALGQPVVLLNKPGASGTLGMHDVATAEPNGYAIGQGVNSIFTITRISGTAVPFTLDDFSLLGNYATDVSVLAVSADAPWRTLDDIIDYVHSNPGKLNYASAGAGTSLQTDHGRRAVSGRRAAHHGHSRPAGRHRHGALHHRCGHVRVRQAP